MIIRKAKPLVSVIVPSFNQGRFIRETIDSILDQDYRPLEVLVVDGASTDNTVDVLRSYGKVKELKWLSEPDKGVTDAVNKGLRRATGEILAIQSSDDVYLPGAITKSVAAMEEHPSVAIVYGDVELIDENSCLMGKDILGPFDLRHYLGRFTYIPQPTAFFRAEVAQKMEGWRKEVSYAADADFWLRMAVRHEVVKINAVMGRYRYHSEQRDVHKTKIARDWERSVKDLLAANALDSATRRFAVMGVHLAKHRYTEESKWPTRTLHLYRAAISNPRGIFSPMFPKRELLLGRIPIWKFLSRVKRAMGFQPRVMKTQEHRALR